MTKDERAQFVDELIGRVSATIKRKVPDMPDEWTGRQLRQFIAEAFAQQAMPVMNPRQRKAYRNDVIDKNLYTRRSTD